MLGLDLVSLETLLPFLLIVAIVYGALETAGMFRNKKVKTIIAVVLGFFSVMNTQVVETINGLLPYAAIVFVLIFIAGYMKKSLSGGAEKDNTMIIIIFALGLLFIASLASSSSGFNLSQYTDLLWLVGAVAVIAILYAAYRMK